MSNQEKVIDDVRALLASVARGEEIEVSDEVADTLGKVLGERFKTALRGRTPRSRTEERKLHFSEIGHPCRRHLWYKVHQPELAEPMSGSTIFKFLYGDLIEELYLALVRLSGHEVTDEQKRCEIDLPNGWKITGYLDAKIDGEVVDVKSASTPSFRKFEDGLSSDPFGYHDQMRGYVHSEGEDRGTFHVVDKTLGHVTKLSQKYNPFSELEKENIVKAVDRDTPPERGFDPVPDGKSGNLKLGVQCSYCAFKHECWSDANDGAGLRTFLYSSKPVFLVHVAKEPRVPEYTGS